MDHLRGQSTKQKELARRRAGLNSVEDDTGREPPPAAIGQDERRMQVRAYNFWAGMLQDRNFPPVEELDSRNQPDFGPYSVLLDFTRSVENPAVAYLGSRLAEECGTAGEIHRLSDVPSLSLLSRITDHYPQILTNEAPIGFEAEFVNQRGYSVFYRGILLPFSSDNKSLDYIYGVINWKELADQHTTDALLFQIGQALQPRDDSTREQLPLTEWADGPVDEPDVLDFAAGYGEGPREETVRKLRKIAPRGLRDISAEGEEFTVLVARRMPDGEIALLGEVSKDATLLDRAAKHLLG